MTGFQIVLSVIVGIILLIVLILSIPVKVSLGFDDKIRLSVKYLFLKFDILPAGPKKEKSDKPPKEPKPPKEKTEQPRVEKKPNPIVEMVKANGFDGMMVVIKNLGEVIGVYGGKLFKSIVFDEITVHISVGTGDSAATAIKYGKICRKVYPVMGFICANNLVRKYDIVVEPDFLANKTEGDFYCDMNVTIRKIINATIGLAVRLVFKVLLKFFTGAKENKKENIANDSQTMKG